MYFFIYVYFKKIQIILLKFFYQMGLKIYDNKLRNPLYENNFL